MLEIQVRQMMGQVFVGVKCHHGWRDRTGHMLHHEILDMNGEGACSLLVAVQDATSRLLKDRADMLCTMDESTLELAE